MKRIGILVATIAIGLFAIESFAQPPQRAEKGAGQRGQARQAGQGRQGAQQRDPQQMAKMMMEKFDKDGDKKLDARELAAALTAMREQRGGQGAARQRGDGEGGPAAGQRRRPGAERAGKGAGGKGKPGAGAKGKPGGERPKRPQDDA